MSEYIHFPLPDSRRFRPSFSFLSDADFQTAWQAWMNSFYRRARLAYASQRMKRQEHLWETFTRSHNLTTDYELASDDEVLCDAYDRLLREDGYYDLVAAEQQALSSLEMLTQHGQQTWVTPTALFSRFFDRCEALRTGRPHPDLLEPQFDRLWFDMTIQNDDATARDLRRMPYSEYLLTPHWTRVKEAVRLIHGARCQGDQCDGMDSYWRDEHLLHVHHRHYRNRGNERYDDLCLLCFRCHEAVHKHGEDAVLHHAALQERVTLGYIAMLEKQGAFS